MSPFFFWQKTDFLTDSDFLNHILSSGKLSFLFIFFCITLRPVTIIQDFPLFLFSFQHNIALKSSFDRWDFSYFCVILFLRSSTLISTISAVVCFLPKMCIKLNLQGPNKMGAVSWCGFWDDSSSLSADFQKKTHYQQSCSWSP